MATTPGFKRLTSTLLALAATFASAAAARAGGNWLPLLPSQDFYNFQLFAPPDLQDYEIYPEASEGLFFTYDRTYWGITVPNVAEVGNTQFFPVEPINPYIAQQLNSANGGYAGIIIYGTDQFNLALNTSWMMTKMQWGNRYEGGWIYDDQGMVFSYFDSGPQNQSFFTINEYALNTPEQEFEQDTATGQASFGGVAVPIVTTTITSTSPPPDHLIVQNFQQRNSTQIQSGGAAWAVRRALGTRGSGGTVRFGLGPRFVQVADRYSLEYRSDQYTFDVGSSTSGGGGGGGGGGNNNGGGGGNAQGGGGGNTGGGNTGGGGGGLTGGGINQNITSVAGGSYFTIGGTDTLTGQGLGTPLQRGGWDTSAYNNIVGPEFSMHFEKTRGRWTFLSDLKMTAGFNWQNMLYRGSNFPNTMSADFIRSTFVTATTFTATSTTASPVTVSGQPLYIQVFGVGQKNGTNAAEHVFQFTPVGEWRLGAEFRVSQAILLRAGYTGMWMGQIARASTNTTYVTQFDNVTQSVPNPTYDPNQPISSTNPLTVVQTTPVAYSRIAPAPNVIQDYLFANGIDFGLEVKY